MRITDRMLKQCSDEQLQMVIANANVIRTQRESAASLRAELSQQAEKAGLSLSDIIKGVGRGRKGNGATASATGRKVAPKWRHRKDPNLTWSGRGRTPKWVPRQAIKITNGD